MVIIKNNIYNKRDCGDINRITDITNSKHIVVQAIINIVLIPVYKKKYCINHYQQ